MDNLRIYSDNIYITLPLFLPEVNYARLLKNDNSKEFLEPIPI